MVATPPEETGETVPAVPPGAPEIHRHQRYNHLLGRLRTRQITMEEATELFAMMQAMLRASEQAARRAAMVAAPGPATGTAPPHPHPGVPVATSTVPDDMFLVGLLAMGAGAGLLAAMARKLGEGPPSRDETEKSSTVRHDA